MTKDDFLSKFSSDYDELNNIYNAIPNLYF